MNFRLYCYELGYQGIMSFYRVPTLVPTAWKGGKKRLHVGGSLAMKPLLSGIKKYCLPSTRRVLLCLHYEFRYYALTQFASCIDYVES